MKEQAYLDTRREQIELNDNVKLNLFGRVTCEPGWQGEEHSHDFWELVFIYKTERDPFLIRWQGGEHVSENTALYLLPAGVRHQFENTGQVEAQNVYVGFSFSYAFDPAALEKLPVVLPVENPVVARLVTLLSELSAPMDNAQLFEALNNKRPEVLRRVMDVVRWISERSEGGSGAVDRNLVIIDKIKEYISNNLDRYISVDELAHQIYLSPNYLGQVFRQNTGMTVKNYHNQMRMERALNILVSGEKTISEVADEMGFESVAYFSRRFKMFYGISPSALFRGGEEEYPEDAQESGRV